MSSGLAPPVRSRFAKRLRALRAQRGYERARHFAQSLGIEENRYTRYERAEVEPDLTLIFAMCQKLNVTPNELLGFGEEVPDPERSDHFQEPPGISGSDEGRMQARRATATATHSLAWHLATEVARIQAEGQAAGKAPAEPLTLMRDAGRLYSRLTHDPFGTVAEIVNDPGLQHIGAERRAKLAELIQAYTERASS